MTDRLKGCFVAFDRDIREDDAETLINAIRCLRCVLSVETHVTDLGDWNARERVRLELWEKVRDVFFPERATEKRSNG